MHVVPSTCAEIIRLCSRLGSCPVFVSSKGHVSPHPPVWFEQAPTCSYGPVQMFVVLVKVSNRCCPAIQQQIAHVRIPRRSLVGVCRAETSRYLEGMTIPFDRCSSIWRGYLANRRKHAVPQSHTLSDRVPCQDSDFSAAAPVSRIPPNQRLSARWTSYARSCFSARLLLLMRWLAWLRGQVGHALAPFPGV